MTDYEVRKELSAEAGGWCAIGFVVIVVLGCILALLGVQ